MVRPDSKADVGKKNLSGIGHAGRTPGGRGVHSGSGRRFAPLVLP